MSTPSEDFAVRLQNLLLAGRGSDPSNTVADVEIEGHTLLVTLVTPDDPSDRSVENDGLQFIVDVNQPG